VPLWVAREAEAGWRAAYPGRNAPTLPAGLMVSLAATIPSLEARVARVAGAALVAAWVVWVAGEQEDVETLPSSPWKTSTAASSGKRFWGDRRVGRGGGGGGGGGQAKERT